MRWDRVMPSGLRIESGNILLFDHIDPEGPMWAGSGARSVTTTVCFPGTFDVAPIVQVSIGTIDASHEQNLRLRLDATGVSTDGFTLEAHTWGDTRIGRLAVNWLALGHERFEAEEEWDV